MDGYICCVIIYMGFNDDEYNVLVDVDLKKVLEVIVNKSEM